MSNAIMVSEIADKAVIRFTRAEVRNPLSIFVLDELRNILEQFETNTNVSTVIFTGSEDIFASGADLREISGVDADGAMEFAEKGQSLTGKIAGLRQTTVAAINGYCFGGALDLALACDERIATPNATFCHPGVGLGIITGWGGTQRLPRLIGEANALKLFFTASPIDAEEALRIGLIDRIENEFRFEDEFR